MSGDALIAELAAIVGAGHLLRGADTEPFSTDWRGRYHGEPLCVVRPADAAQLAQVVQRCAAAQMAMVPQGGNTGLCGGATPIGGEVLVSLSRLNRVRAVDALNNTITVEAGCTLQQVQQAAAAADRLFPLSIASEGSATIGGNLSTNAGGVQVLRYGNARDLALGLEVVLPDGRLWNGLRGLRKDNTGYDLKHLFIGAEGTLGFITAATLRLFARPRQMLTAWGAVASPAKAVTLLAVLRDRVGDCLTAFELVSAPALALVLRHIPDSRMPLPSNAAWQLLIEFSGGDTLEVEAGDALAAAYREGLLDELVLASSQTQAQALWSLRENISEAQKREGISIKHDIAVPISRLDELIARAGQVLQERFPDIRIVCFGHVGDGNLHYNVSKPEAKANVDLIAITPEINCIVHDIVADLGGSISAEHGLGQLKREEIQRYKSSIELVLMRSVKAALDPLGLMNPGKVLATE